MTIKSVATALAMVKTELADCDALECPLDDIILRARIETLVEAAPPERQEHVYVQAAADYSDEHPRSRAATAAGRLAEGQKCSPAQTSMILKFEAWLKTLTDEEAKTLNTVRWNTRGSDELDHDQKTGILVTVTILDDGVNRGIRPVFGG